MNSTKCKIKYSFLLSIILLFAATQVLHAQKAASCKSPSKKDINWFDSKKWLEGTDLIPDAGIDIGTFADHYKKHPERWVRLFRFVKENDLSALPVGKQTLSDDLTISVEEYTTREPGKEWLEAHKKYIDVQIVVKGAELQGTATIADTLQTVRPYKPDVVNYTADNIVYRVIRPKHFTIFFPHNLHIPNIQYGEKAPVRKVVFKVAVD